MNKLHRHIYTLFTSYYNESLQLEFETHSIMQPLIVHTLVYVTGFTKTDQMSQELKSKLCSNINDSLICPEA